MRPLRYLLFTYEDASAVAHHLLRIRRQLDFPFFEQRDRYALFASDTVSVLAFPFGVVAGTLFRRHGPAEPLKTLSDEDIATIKSSAGRVLIDCFWGSYVAAVEEQTGLAKVLRDPSGGLPCYYISGTSFTIHASDPELLVDVGLLQPAIDWNAFARYLYLPDLPSTQTALTGLRELAPGTSLRGPSQDKSLAIMWSPWEHIDPKEPVPGEPVAERLGRTIRHCSTAWGNCFESVLVGVSGGLDSSIVAASLSHKRSALSLLTLVAEDPAGDERDHARILSHAVDAELLERPYLLSNIDIDRAVGQHLPRPGARTQALAYDKQVIDVLNSRSIDAFFTGNGGDNVFYLSHSARAIVDRFLAEGLGWHLVETIRDICKLTGCSFVRATAEALRVYRNGNAPYRWPIDRSYLNEDLVPSDIEHRVHHPWLQAPAGAWPGKKAHIAMLLRMQNHLEGFDRKSAPPVINPLTSQPVVELCLKIPSWKACKGGRDRSVAREAFETLLPPLIVGRTTKGGPDGFASQILSRHRDGIRERLLDGILAANGLLDRGAITRDLQLSGGDQGLSFVRLLLLLDAEAWAKYWQNRGFRTIPDPAPASAAGLP